jgi:hypothetical protein
MDLRTILAAAVAAAVAVASSSAGRAQTAAAPAPAPAAAAPTAPVTPAPEPVMPPAEAAILQGLDKTTARVSTFEAPIDRSVKFGTLVITARACIKHPPEEPPESAAFLQIDELRSLSAGAASERIFSGWMFASSPALSALENPVYDISVLDCKIPSGSPAKSTGK